MASNSLPLPRSTSAEPASRTWMAASGVAPTAPRGACGADLSPPARGAGGGGGKKPGRGRGGRPARGGGVKEVSVAPAIGTARVARRRGFPNGPKKQLAEGGPRRHRETKRR